MSDSHNCSLIVHRRSAPPELLPALVFSVALHAAAGSLLFSTWQPAPLAMPRPLAVTLQAAPPLVIESKPSPIEHKHVKQEANARSLPTLSLPHAPERVPLPVERAEAAPPVVAPAPESAVTTIVANAPDAIIAPGRADAIEPPHFNAAYLNNPEPPYPSLAKKLGLEGRVVLRVQVSAKGKPEQIVVAQTSGAPLLDDAALKAVQGWTFKPSQRGDLPYASAIDVPIRFQLKN